MSAFNHEISSLNLPNLFYIVPCMSVELVAAGPLDRWPWPVGVHEYGRI
jgi:hypothetical protein